MPRPSGFLLARDPATNQDRWRVDLEDGRFNGMLVTAGNVLFTGRRDGAFLAYDATTGQQLWETAISSAPASPITYELDGRQYVTVLTAPAAGTEGTAGRVYTFVME